MHEYVSSIGYNCLHVSLHEDERCLTVVQSIVMFLKYADVTICMQFRSFMVFSDDAAEAARYGIKAADRKGFLVLAIPSIGEETKGLGRVKQRSTQNILSGRMIPKYHTAS